MDLIFNELSLLHQVESEQHARSAMQNLLQTCKAAKKNLDSAGLRVRPDFFTAELAGGYSVTSWLADSLVPRDLKNLLLGLKRYPYIDENDDNIEERFIENNYFLHAKDEAMLHGREAEGLAVAFLYNSLAVSLQTYAFWKNSIICLLEKRGGNEHFVDVKHGCTPAQLVDHQEWFEAQRPVELLTTELAVADKAISLRDDHGQDVLMNFAMRLVRSPYIVGVINSLPFNPWQRNFIKQIFPNGQLELVLTWTDMGLGCVVQTTGRNIQETRSIAEILRENFAQ